MHTVDSAAEARRRVGDGVDVIVAQGVESGGHVWGQVSTMALDLDRLLARMDLDSLEAAEKVLARELRRRRRAQTAPRSNGANGSGSG